jgi:hypothetical protein
MLASQSAEIVPRMTSEDNMPHWMRVSKGETIGTETPVARRTMKQMLCDAGRAFKTFFKDHAKMYRM